MPTVADEAICIRHWDFSETSQTVSLFTRGHGLMRGLAKGAKRERGRFSGGIDLLTRGQVVAIVKPGRELVTLTDWNLLGTYRWLRERLDANRAGFYMAELVLRMLRDADPHPAVYDALVNALEGLAEPAARDAVLVRFQWALLEETGYRPRLEPTPRKGAESGAGRVDTLVFSPSEGGVVDASLPGWRVRVETLRLLQAVASGEAGAARAEDATPETWGRAARLLAAYLREIIGDEPVTLRAALGAV